MIDNELLKQAAYAMQRAYIKESNMGDAVHSVSEKFPEIDSSNGIFRAMWLAIDAYVDLIPS